MFYINATKEKYLRSKFLFDIVNRISTSGIEIDSKSEEIKEAIKDVVSYATTNLSCTCQVENSWVIPILDNILDAYRHDFTYKKNPAVIFCLYHEESTVFEVKISVYQDVGLHKLIATTSVMIGYNPTNKKITFTCEQQDESKN